MRTIGKIALTLGVVALLIGPALAQGPRGFGGGPPGPMLLMNPGVRKELKLTDEQVGKLVKIGESMREKHRDDFRKLRDLDEKERHQKAGELMKSVRAEAHTALADILKPEQLKRFDQIERQQHVPQSFLDPEVKAQLKLTDDQEAKLKEINEGLHKEMRAAFKESEGKRREGFKKVRALHKEAKDKALDVLTADQKATWKDLTGEPFEVEWEGPGGDGGGRGRGER